MFEIGLQFEGEL